MAAIKQAKKSYLTTFWLASFTGIFGADRFYLGQTKLAVLKLLTLGGVGVWAFTDMLRLLLGRPKDNRRRLLYGETKQQMTLYQSLAVGMVLVIIPFMTDNLYNVVLKNQQPQINSVAAAAGVTIVSSFLFGAVFFIGFTVVDAFKRKYYAWVCVNIISFLIGLGIINICYYFFVKPKDHPLVAK